MASNESKTPKILSENLFPVVGIGASAGGLDAFKEFVGTIPENSGMAYIFVQHLAPQYESILPDIIQKATKLPVIKITDHIKVVPDHIYIIPANKVLTANDGVLLLDPLNKEERVHSIDVFFTSLAEIHQEHAIGIVLSGTGTDGTVGLKTIKDQGGITMVQNKDSAAYFAMPQSAIEADVVDYVLPPEEMSRHLMELIRNTGIAETALNSSDDSKKEELFRKILALLRLRSGVDFTFYKQTTIRRRILRRIALNKMDRLKDYEDYLLENKTEQDSLFKDLLIPVTAFFRDPNTFATLSEAVFPVLFKDRVATEAVRIWIAGCATGEEAYSMAICLHEHFSELEPTRKIQIFATDISETVIAKARSGVYRKKDMAGVSEERMKKFFTKIDGSYQVNKVIREMCVFATQNFLKDPPFAKVDLISCRNVLIYMEPYLQKKALTTFHYALSYAGFLLLGKSETASQVSNLFHPFNRQEKIYTRKLFVEKYTHVASENREAVLTRKSANLKNAAGRRDDFQQAGDDALLAKYATVGVIVNEQWNILQFRGSTGAYLEAPPGKASHNILKMAREGLSLELRNALHTAKSTNEAVRKEGIAIDNGTRHVNMEVIPLQNTIEVYFLVLFTEKEDKVLLKARRKKSNEEETSTSNEQSRIEELEKELARVYQDMRAITEEQDSVNEELQSVNEELLAGSEELQSLNEELETTKEEIQSSNEELTILNQELLERNEQLIYSRKYAEAIVSTIHDPLIILTKDFHVKSANKAFYDVFQLTEQLTEGRFFFDLAEQKWNIPELLDKLNKILPEQLYFEGLELEVAFPSKSAGVMMFNARPLVNDHSNEQLILLAIHDITERKILEKNQQQFAHELELQVVERTKELKEVNVDLLHSNENLQQFASIASHDLQEPLRKIKTFTAILTKRYCTDLPDGGKELISKIKLSADRMSQLIKEVLEYSKLTHAPKEFIRTDLNTIMQNVMNDLDLLVSESDAVIHYKKALPIIAAIPLQMNQLFYNLLINALKFRKSATSLIVHITFRLLSAEEANKNLHLRENLVYVEIMFSDNGIGFEQQFADQIFQLFERLHSADEYEGTGVGLALCKKIVENHHGYIFAVSKEGEGASFYVILPVEQ